MDQVQADVLELAGNLLLQTRAADSELSLPHLRMQGTQGKREGQVPLTPPGPGGFNPQYTSHQSPSFWAAAKIKGEAAALGLVSEGKVWTEKEKTGMGKRAFGNNQNETIF